MLASLLGVLLLLMLFLFLPKVGVPFTDLLYLFLLPACVPTAGVWCGSVVAVKVIQVKQPSALSFPARASAQQHSQPELRSHPLGGASDAAAAAAVQPTAVCDSQAAQVALELAQHEYESWLNANLRHPNIVQLFTSFTIGLEERVSTSGLLPPSLLMFGGSSAGDGAAAGEECGTRLSSSACDSGAGLSWRTHLVMEFCELGTMQVSTCVLPGC